MNTLAKRFTKNMRLRTVTKGKKADVIREGSRFWVEESVGGERVGGPFVSQQSALEWLYSHGYDENYVEDGMKSFDFFRKVYKGDTASILKGYTPVQKAAMGTTSGTVGGYLTPTEYSTLLFQAVAEHSFIEPRATVVPMGSYETICPRLDAETAQAAGTTPFFGGLKFVWGNQNPASLTESEPTFDALTLTARDLIGELIVSNQFLADLTEEGELALLEMLGQAAAWYKEYAFINGTGADADQPLGILNAPCKIAVTRAGAGTIAQADVAKIIKSLLPFSWATSVWACSPTTLEPLMKITGFVPNEDPLGTEAGAAGSLMTRPVFVTEKLPAVGTTGDLVLFDPALYVIGNRQEVVIEMSKEPRFANNQTVIRVWLRADGKPLLANAVTLADAASTASCVVVLAT